MKLSLKIRDEPQHQTPLIKAKIPITVLTLPFISGFVAGDSSDLSFNLTTNFSSCPSLRISYSPNSVNSPPFSVKSPPFSMSIKSGVGAFGSPRDSPLVISADLNLFCDRNPSFMLQIKPRVGHFSLHKTASSNSSPNPRSGQLSNSGSEADSGLMGWSNIDIESGGKGSTRSSGFGMERSVTWQDLKMESFSEKNRILSGFKVLARSELPVTSKLMVNFRWGVNFPADVRKQLPYLTVNKIGIQRVEEVKEVKKVEDGVEVGEVEKLSGIYSWLRKDLEELRAENRGLRRSLDELKASLEVRNCSSDFEAKKSQKPKPVSAQMFDSGSKRNGVDERAHKVLKKIDIKSGSLEDELQKAIKAASASAS